MHRPNRQLWRKPRKHHRHLFLTPFHPCFSIILFSYRPYFLAFPEIRSNRCRQTSDAHSSFSPASLHFTLGLHLYGHSYFLTYDLSTAFAILRSALYLSLTTFHDEIQARIVQEILHGLSHAFVSFAEYERLTGRKWGTGGCRCRQCARRALRVLEFALEDDVKNVSLDRGARRALVGLFGEG
jgi:hypothetical protein